MLAKDERKAMLLRLFNDDTPLKDRSKERFAAKAQEDASTSTLRSTTAERAKVHYMADEPAGDEEEPVDEEAEGNGADGEEAKPKIGEVDDDDEEGGVEVNVGGGEGIMRIGGAD